MTIRQAIAMADEMKPNAFSTATKVFWLSRLDGTIAAELMLMAQGEQTNFAYTADNLDQELLVNPPYDDLYLYWLEAQIDYQNGEYDKYDNTMQRYNRRLSAFCKWFRDYWDPVQGYGCKPGCGQNPPYYISAYALACKTGFEGTLEEWLASLKGDKGDDGKGFVVLGTYETLEALTEAVPEPEIGDAYGVGTEEPYEIYIWEEDGWTDHGTLQGPQGPKGDPGEDAKLDGIVTPEDYGAKADGVTDDTEAFRQALASGKIVLAQGTYMLGSADSAGRVEITTDATLVCTPQTRFIRGDVRGDNQSGFFQATGERITKDGEPFVTTIVSDVPEGEQQIQVAEGDGAYFQVGNLLCINHGAAEKPDAYKRMVTKIRAVSGDVITLAHGLNYDYPAETATVTTYKPVTFHAYGNGAIIDGARQGESRSSNSQRYGFWLFYNEGSVIEGFRVVNSISGVARYDRCVDCVLSECEGFDPVRIDPPYGEFASIAYSTEVLVEKTRTYGYRRSVDLIGAYLSKAQNCFAARGGFTTHGYLAKDCTFAGCEAVVENDTLDRTNIVGNESYSYDKRITFDGCRFYGGRAPLKVMAHCSAILRDCYIETINGNGRDCGVLIQGPADGAGGGSSAELYSCKIKAVGYCVSAQNRVQDERSYMRLHNCELESIYNATNANRAVRAGDMAEIELYGCTIRGTAQGAAGYVHAYGCTFENEVSGTDTQIEAGDHSSYIDCRFTGSASILPGASDVSIIGCTFNTVPDTLELEEEPTDRNIRIVGCRHRSALGVQEDLDYNILVRDNTQTELPDGTATGTDGNDPADIPDGAAGADLLEMLVTLTPEQPGSGDPSPSNVRPISGCTGVTISQSGRDTSDPDETEFDWEDDAGTVYAGTLDVLTGILTATFRMQEFRGDNLAEAAAGRAKISLSLTNAGEYGKKADMISDQYKTITTQSSNAQAMRMTNDGRQLFLYDTARFTDAETARSVLNASPVHVLYPLATPVTYQLTPAEMQTLRGENHIWASDGEVFVRYRKDPSWNVCYVPPGGTDGQVLAKASNDDFDLEWISGGGGGGTSDYDQLSNRPQINGNTLTGNKTAAQLGLGTYSKPSGGIPASDLASGVIPTVPSAATADPENLGTKAVGTSTKYAREDHVHQMPSASDVGAVAAPSSPSAGDVLTYNGSAWGAAAPAKEVFVCTYNSTTSAEIEAAYQVGKICVVTYNSKLFQLVYRGSATSHTFACFIDSSATTGQNVSCSSDSWTAATAHELLRAPSSPSVGDFLVYTANGWAAAALPLYNGGVS